MLLGRVRDVPQEVFVLNFSQTQTTAETMNILIQ